MFQSAPPDVAVSLETGRVAAVRLTTSGGTPVVAAHAVVPLPPEAIAPSLAAINIADTAAVTAAIRQAMQAVDARTRRVALVVPDALAKISLVRFEKVPPRETDLEELVRWQVKKSAPFPMDQARVSFTPGQTLDGGGREFIVSAVRTDLLEQYERVCTEAGLQPGVVDIASLNVINGIQASAARPETDWLLVYIAPAYTTLAVIRNGELIFFRNRVEGTDGTLADLVHQTAMYYEDRLGGAGFSRVLVCGGSLVPQGADALRRDLQERLGVPVEGVDARTIAALADRISAGPDLLDALAPLVGVLVRERQAA